MPYATQQDLIDRFGEDELIQLTDRAGAGVIDQVVLGRALADAAAEIDGYIAGRANLPLVTVPTVLVKVAADLARYSLFGDRLTDVVKVRRDNAVALLKSISNGSVSLGLDGASQAIPDVGGVAVNAGSRTFTAAGLVDY